MSNSPTLPADVAAKLADLERRLDNLERSPRLPFSSTRGGAFVFFDENGSPRWVMGNVHVTGAGAIQTQEAYAVVGQGDGGATVFALRQGDRGIGLPIINLPMVRTNNFIVVTSGTFASTHNVTVDFSSWEVINFETALGVDAATTGEIRLRDGITGQTTNAIQVVGPAIPIVRFAWLHPAACGSGDPRGRSVTLGLNVEARRVSGAGNVNVYDSSRVQLSSLLATPDATTNGIPA